MKTLFLAWQAPGTSRAWYPIGRLNADAKKRFYHFVYTCGALQAQSNDGFQPLLSFPDFKKDYESAELFPLFKNRVLDPSRKDFAQYLSYLELDPGQTDPIEILSLTGGERQTDSLEVFPKIERQRGGLFSYRFFLHGLRHVTEVARKRAENLQPGESLRVSVELNNPATKLAIQLCTDDYQFIGWAPRYLVEDMVLLTQHYSEIQAHVVRINKLEAPLARRVLIEMSGKLPSDYEPMSSQPFLPISTSCKPTQKRATQRRTSPRARH
jgi:hypothetical protein